MKKIALDLNALRVDSFATTARDSGRRGTVHAAGASEEPTQCLGPTCGTCEPTFAYSCYGTCVGDTCEDVCSAMVTC
jgi:hypothetical protein